MSSNGNGSSLYHVGCQFVARATYSEGISGGKGKDKGRWKLNWSTKNLLVLVKHCTITHKLDTTRLVLLYIMLLIMDVLIFGVLMIVIMVIQHG